MIVCAKTKPGEVGESAKKVAALTPTLVKNTVDGTAISPPSPPR